MIKLIFLILFLPLASPAQSGYTGYTQGLNKIGEILFNHSQERKDLEAGYKHYRDKLPDYFVRPMEILIPTLIGLEKGKLELRYAREF